MSNERTLDEANLQVLVPLPPRISAIQVVLIVLGVDLLLFIVQLADGGNVHAYLGAALVVTLVVPPIFAFERLLFPRHPHNVALALDRDRVLAPSGWGTIHLEWDTVRTLAYVHSISPGSSTTLRIDRQLLVVERGGRRSKLDLPRLGEAEWPVLQRILRRIADYHGFELVFDTSEEGRLRLAELRSRK